MPKKSTGYYFDQKSGRYKIDKLIGNQRIRYLTRWGKGETSEVERELAHHIDRLHRVKMYGERIPRQFREAAVRYLILNQHQRQIAEVEGLLRRLDPFIGDVFIHELHGEHPEVLRFVASKQREGCKTKTINAYLEIVRRVLRTAEDWRDDATGLTWLERAPKIKLPPVKDARPPRPLSWESQSRLLQALPEHQQELALFFINTGVRKKEALLLQWDWEVALPTGQNGFLLPDWLTKNGRERFVPLNSLAKGVIDRQRGKHSDRVFTYGGQPLATVNNTSFQRIRSELGIDVRIHDYRHTFGHRLRVAGVDEEMRATLLGHASGSITTHYSVESLDMLFEAVERLTVPQKDSPTVIMLSDYKGRVDQGFSKSPKSPHQGFESSC